MKKRYKWTAWFRYDIGGYSREFYGREPFDIDSEEMKVRFLDLGVFEVLSNGRFRYKAPYGYRREDKSGKEYVDAEGYLDLDLDDVALDIKDKIYQELEEEKI